MENKRNILSNYKEPDEDLLIRYLQGNLLDEERFEVEATMIDSGFVNDAVEGLNLLQNKKNIEQSIQALNRELEKHIETKRRKKRKNKILPIEWIIIYVVIVIFLCLIGFAIIHIH
jgi:t-SNARE complex subunit (syntaxin)